MKPADNSPVVDALIVDAAVVVNALRPGTSHTFHDYADNVFLPYVRRQMEGVKRIDIVWDVYIENSLKKTARFERGEGVRRRVQDSSKVPGNWQSFFRSEDNKTELFEYLSRKIAGMPNDSRQIITTLKDGVLSNFSCEDVKGLYPHVLTKRQIQD